MVKKQLFNPWDSVKVDSSEIVSHNYTLVDFEYLFLWGSFGLENFHTCNQHIYGSMKKIP